MIEMIFEYLPSTAKACRRLYNMNNGGYHIPDRRDNILFDLNDVSTMKKTFDVVQYDCIEVPVADLISSIIINTHSKFILETGTSRGFSTSHIAAAAKVIGGSSSRVITIDLAPCENLMFHNSQLEEIIETHKVDSLTFSLDVKCELDLIFLDSKHSYQHLSKEIERFLPLLKVGGVMILHDTLFYDGLGLIILCLMQFHGVEVLTMPTHRTHERNTRSPGITLIRKLSTISSGDIRFPQAKGELNVEATSINNKNEIINDFGFFAFNENYAAKRVLTETCVRDNYQCALLDPCLIR